MLYYYFFSLSALLFVIHGHTKIYKYSYMPRVTVLFLVGMQMYKENHGKFHSHSWMYTSWRGFLRKTYLYSFHTLHWYVLHICYNYVYLWMDLNYAIAAYAAACSSHISVRFHHLSTKLKILQCMCMSYYHAIQNFGKFSKMISKFAKIFLSNY